MEKHHVNDVQSLSADVFPGIAANLFEMVPYILYVLSVPSYRFIYANQAQVDLIRDPNIRTPADLQGKHPWEVIPRWKELVMPVYEEVRNTAEPRYLRDIQFQLAWGTSYRDMSIIPNVDPETGSVISISTLTIDITDRKQAEEALRSSEEKYRSIAESAAEAIIAADSDGNVISWNKGAETMFGYTAGEMIGTPEAILMPERYREVHKEGLERMRRTGRGHIVGDTVEFCGLRKDGTEFPLEVSLSTWRTDQGRFYGAIIRDISEHKQVEARLGKALETAEQSSARETEALAVAQYQLTILQRALLPRDPILDERYVVATTYIPAFASQEVGGDFYDVFKAPNEKAGILIGDVSGKGIEAASLAAATRSTIRAFTHEFLSPGKVLTHANSVLYPQQPSPESFVTAFLVVLDMPSGSLLCSGAGHVAPAISRRTGKVEFLELGHPPLGLYEVEEFDEIEAQLEPGDMVILYTDGVSEARRDSEMFGTEGIERALVKMGHRSPYETVDLLVAAAADWGRGRLTDDVGVVVVERMEAVGPSR